VNHRGAPTVPHAASKSLEKCEVTSRNCLVGRRGLEPRTNGLKARNEPERSPEFTAEKGHLVGHEPQRLAAQGKGGPSASGAGDEVIDTRRSHREELVAPAPRGTPSEGGADESGPVADDSIGSRGPLTATADSPTPAPGTHRRALLVHLAEALGAAIAAGDIEAARVTHDAIGRLLGSSSTQIGPGSLTPERRNLGGDDEPVAGRRLSAHSERAPQTTVSAGGRTRGSS